MILPQPSLAVISVRQSDGDLMTNTRSVTLCERELESQQVYLKQSLVIKLFILQYLFSVYCRIFYFFLLYRRSMLTELFSETGGGAKRVRGVSLKRLTEG